MRFAVVGGGATGSRTARQLNATADTTVSVIRRGDDLEGTYDAVVLCTPAPQHELARDLIAQATPVVVTTDDRDDLSRCLDLGPRAEAAGVPIVIGAGFAPGLSCLLARFAARSLVAVDEVHIAKHGTGGPACARQHHRALAATGQIWRDERWQTRVGGSGRELCWFPDPVGAHDCYNADLGDPLLLLEAFPDASRLSARCSATRRDRLTSRMPMMRKPHPEGGLGAIRVEVRGTRADGTRSGIVFGAIDRPAIAAGTVAAITAVLVAAPRVLTGSVVLGDTRLDTLGILTELASRGVKAAEFTGLGSIR